MELFTLLGKIAVDASGVDGVISNVTSKVESLGGKMETAGQKLSDIGGKLTLGLTTPLALLGGKAIKTAADFESAMSEVGAISGATGEDFTTLEELAKRMGETTKFSASEAAEALKYMAMAGWKTQDMTGGLEGVLNLAAASGEDLATTSDIVTDALTAMGYSAGDAGRLADVMAAASSNANTNVSLMGETFKYAGTMAGTMGYSMEDVALAIGLMANSGVKGSMAGTALNAIISRLATNTNGATEQINALGVEFYNADGSARNLGDVMDELREATRGLTTEQQAEIASTIAGEEAKKGLLAILNATEADYSKLKKAIDDCGGSAKGMADTMNNNLSGQLTLLKSQLEALAIQFVTLIMPYLMQGVEWLSKLCTWISGLDEGTKKMILTIAGIVAAAGPVLTVGGKILSGAGKLVSGISGIIGAGSKIAPLISTVLSGGGKVAGGIVSLVGKIGGTLIPAISSVPAPVWIVIAVLGALVAAGVAIYKNWDEIRAWASKTWSAITETIGAAAEKIGGFFSRIVDFFKNNWQGIGLFIVNPIVGGFKLLYDNCETFRNFIDGFLNGLKEGWHNFTQNISDKFHELKENVSAKAHELKENIVNKFQEIRDGAEEKFHNLKESVVTKVEEMKENASAKIHEMAEKVSTGFQEMKERAAEKFDDLQERWTAKFEGTRERMVSLVEEMREGVTQKAEQLRETAVEKVENLRSAAVEKFTQLKEDAVSKIGEMRDRGAEGINSFKEQAQSAIGGAKDFIVGKFHEMAESAGNKFREIGSNITDIFGRARDTVKDIVDKVKEFFNFDWKLPDIKLPHFSIEGEFGLSPPSIPHLDVEWYAEGGVMNKPTAFGINPYSGNVMVGGEAGAEAIAPIETLRAYIREAVGSDNARLYAVLQAILSLLQEWLPKLAEMQMVLDSGALVGGIAGQMDEELGRMASMRGRRK